MGWHPWLLPAFLAWIVHQPAGADRSSADAGSPPAFAANIVQGKGYDLAAHPDARFFQDVVTRLLGGHVEIDLTEPWHLGGPMFGDPRLVPQRLGQQAFKAVVLDAYDRRCAITGGKIRPVLQAAHIRPVHRGGEHRLDNGLLLRSDVHILYDRGYLAVDPSYKLLVSPRLREEFGNGRQFYERAGHQIALPAAARTGRSGKPWSGIWTRSSFGDGPTQLPIFMRYTR